METTYTVNVDYVGADKGASATADRLGAKLSSLQGGLDAVRSGFGAVTSLMERVAFGVGATAFGGAILGAHTLAGEVIRLGSEAEDTSLAIAAMIGANGAANSWGESMEISQRAMAQIRRDAAALPGEAQDYINIFRSGLAGMLQSGLNTDGAVRLADRVGAVAAMLQVDSQQAGRDLALMLGGRAGAQVRLWTAIQAQVGKTSHEFNALSIEQRRVLLDRALDRYNGAIEASGHTWSALTGTVKTFAQDAIRAFGGPSFDLAKHKLEELVMFLQTHESSIMGTLRRWGTDTSYWLDEAYSRARTGVDYLRENWRRLRDEAVEGIRDIGHAWLALRVGSAGIGAAQGIAGLVGGASLGSLGALAAAATVAVPVVYALSQGAYDTNRALMLLGPQISHAEASFSAFSEHFGPRTAEAGQEMTDGLVSVGALLVGVANAFMDLTQVVDEWSGIDLERILLAALSFGITEALRAAGRASRNDIPHPEWLGGGTEMEQRQTQAALALWTSQQRKQDRQNDAADAAYQDSLTGGENTFWNAAARRAATRPHSPAGHTTIHNHFRIEEADNPERVALTVQHVMERELRNPTQAALGRSMRLR